jgi:hypothetical protein
VQTLAGEWTPEYLAADTECVQTGMKINLAERELMAAWDAYETDPNDPALWSDPAEDRDARLTESLP